MFTNNFIFYGAQVSMKVIMDVLFFPLWWYSFGLAQTIRLAVALLIEKERYWAFTVWMKNIFVPMYGQYDIVGFLISFMVRLFQIAFRGVIMAIWTLTALGLVGFWILMPLIIFAAISRQV